MEQGVYGKINDFHRQCIIISDNIQFYKRS